MGLPSKFLCPRPACPVCSRPRLCCAWKGSSSGDSASQRSMVGFMQPTVFGATSFPSMFCGVIFSCTVSPLVQVRFYVYWFGARTIASLPRVDLSQKQRGKAMVSGLVSWGSNRPAQLILLRDEYRSFKGAISFDSLYCSLRGLIVGFVFFQLLVSLYIPLLTTRIKQTKVLQLLPTSVKYIQNYCSASHSGLDGRIG